MIYYLKKNSKIMVNFKSEGSKKLFQSLVELINGIKEVKILGIDKFF